MRRKRCGAARSARSRSRRRPGAVVRSPIPDLRYPEGRTCPAQRGVQRELHARAGRGHHVAVLAPHAVAVLQQHLDFAARHAGPAREPAEGLRQAPVFEQRGLQCEPPLPKRVGAVRLQQPGVVDALAVAGQAGIEAPHGLAQIDHRGRKRQARGGAGDVADAVGAQVWPAAREHDVQGPPRVMADSHRPQAVARLLLEGPDPLEVRTELPGELPQRASGLDARAGLEHAARGGLERLDGQPLERFRRYRSGLSSRGESGAPRVGPGVAREEDRQREHELLHGAHRESRDLLAQRETPADVVCGVAGRSGSGRPARALPPPGG